MQRDALSPEAIFYAMIQTAETIREAYGRSVERKVPGYFRADSELPASKDKIKAALVLTAFHRKAAGQLDKCMHDVFYMCYGYLAHYVSEDIVLRERKKAELLHEHAGAIQEGLEIWLRVRKEAQAKGKVEKEQAEELEEAERKVEKEAQKRLVEHGGDPSWLLKELGKYDVSAELYRCNDEERKLCDEFERRLQALDDLREGGGVCTCPASPAPRLKPALRNAQIRPAWGAIVEQR